MQNIIARKALLFISIFILLAMACDLSVTVAPSASPASSTQVLASATSLPSTLPPNATSTALEPISSEDAEVFYGPLHLVLRSGLASGIRGSQFPRAEGPDVAPWDVTPGHTQVSLEGYLLQGKSQGPQILVYPAQGYGEQYPGAFESLHRLNNILGGQPITAEQLPAVPFFNAQQAFASNVQLISFQNGRGVRFLTEYAQYPAPANNNELFYQFQGLTSDGAYYVIAILPITVPMLPETGDPGAVLPTGGVPYPYFADPQADMQLYYASVIDVLNATPSDLFTPALNQLDALIQSIKITH